MHQTTDVLIFSKDVENIFYFAEEVVNRRSIANCNGNNFVQWNCQWLQSFGKNIFKRFFTVCSDHVDKICPGCYVRIWFYSLKSDIPRKLNLIDGLHLFRTPLLHRLSKHQDRSSPSASWFAPLTPVSSSSFHMVTGKLDFFVWFLRTSASSVRLLTASAAQIFHERCQTCKFKLDIAMRSMVFTLLYVPTDYGALKNYFNIALDDSS